MGLPMRTPKSSWFPLVELLVILTFVAPTLSQTVVPMLLNDQRGLKSPTTGQPVVDGAYNMVFRIYDAESSGAQR